MRGDTTETSNLDRILQQIQIQNSNPSSFPPSDMSTRTDIGLLQPQKPKKFVPWFSDLPVWEGTLPKISPEELEYRISELSKDIAPGTGQVRSAQRSAQETAKAKGLLEQGKHLEALPHGIWAGVESLDVALSAPWLLGGILSTPLDLARMFKNLKPVRPIPKKVYGGEGAYLGPDKKELTGSFTEGRVNVEDGIKFGVGTPTASILDDRSAGNKVKVNLFKQRAGWKWVGKPPVDTPTIISVEQGNKHYYTLDSDIKNVDLAKYPNQPSEPRLRPSSRGDLIFGEEVGKINLRGKLHPVFDTIEIVPRKSVVPVSPNAVPKLMNKVPVVNPQNLVGKKIFQIPADLTDAGVIYTGIDASKLPKGEPLLGGPGFVDLESSRNSNVVWAVSDKGVSGLPKKIQDSDYAVIVAMSPDAHKSNTSIVNSMLGNMDAYVRDGRIGKRDLQRLNKLIKKKTGNPAHKDLQNFPGFGSKSYRGFVKGLSFEARARIAEQLRSSAGQELGAPNITKILRKTQDPTTYGLGRSDALLLIEIDKGPNNIVDLGEYPGTVPHPSYKKGFKGKVVGKFATPVSYDTLFPDYVSERLKKGKTMANIERASNLEKPIVTITQDIANTLPTQSYQYIQSPRQVELALEAEKGNWKTSLMPVGRGGVSPTDFINAIKNSDASSTLTEYKLQDIQQGIKSGTFNIYQLGGDKSQVFFGIKKTNYADEYGFNHPELGPGERAVVGVVNNEPGAKGVAAPGVMGKAIEEGATALDAFAVPSQKYPSGFLPEVYNDYGFVELGRVPFEEKYYSATQLKDLKEYWRSTGWDESLGMPEVVIMKWKGDNAIRSEAVRLINENGSINPRRQTSGLSETAEEYSGQSSGLNPSSTPRTGGVDNPGGTGGGIRDSNAPRSSERYRNVLSELSLLNPNQRKNLGLKPQSLLQ